MENDAQGASPTTITLELTPEEVATLQSHADAEGADITAVLRGLIARLAPPPVPPGTALGDVPEDVEERAERDREREEVRANLARWRAEQERPPV